MHTAARFAKIIRIGEFWNGTYKITLCKGNLLSEEMCAISIKKQHFKK